MYRHGKALMQNDVARLHMWGVVTSMGRVRMVGRLESVQALQELLSRRDKVVSHVKAQLAQLHKEVSNLKARHTIQSDENERARGDLAHNLKCARSQALTAEVRVDVAVKEAVAKAPAAAPVQACCRRPSPMRCSNAEGPCPPRGVACGRRCHHQEGAHKCSSYVGGCHGEHR